MSLYLNLTGNILNMDLYNIKGGKLKSVDVNPFKLEKDIQQLIENNTNELFGLEFVCSEFKIGEFRLDTLCFDEENNSFVIVEYKKGSSYSVIDQGYSYLSVMLNNKSDFILEYNESMKKTIKRDDIDWTQSKIIFVSPSFNSYQKNSVNFKDVPFELWEIKRFSNNLISLNQHLSKSKESISKITTGKNTVINKVNKEVKVYDIDHLLKSCSEKVIDIWKKMELLLTDSDFLDSRFNYKKSYNRFSKNDNSIICYFEYRKDWIKIEIIGGTIYDDKEKKSKGFCELDDFKKLTTKKEKVWKGGPVKQIEYHLKLDNEKDVDYVISLIKQRYDCL